MKSPFEGRVKKQFLVGTVDQCRDALLKHREACHGSRDLAEFIDCGACAILERQLAQAEKEAEQKVSIQ